MKLAIIGHGALAQSLAQAAYSLGIEAYCIAEEAPNTLQAPYHIITYSDTTRLRILAQSVDIITFEHAHFPASLIETLSECKPVFPSMTALSIAHDRLYERSALKELDIPSVHCVDVKNKEELREALRTFASPVVLKTRRNEGHVLIQTPDEIDAAWDQFKNVSLIAEEYVPLDAEVSLIAVRNGRGDRAYYPLTQTRHEQSTLCHTESPYPSLLLQEEAEEYAKVIMDTWNYVGVMTIDFFVQQGALLVNRVLPHVSTVGYWTLHGAVTSQFENHVRAIFNLHLGSTYTPFKTTTEFLHQPCALNTLLSNPLTHVHRQGHPHTTTIHYVTQTEKSKKKVVSTVN